MKVPVGPESGRRGDVPDDRTLVQAKALADPTRHDIFRYIAESGSAVSIAAVVEVVGVHHNAVRQHLSIMRDAGLVIESRQPTGGRGRPRLMYALRPDLDGRWNTPDPYVDLAAILASAVRSKLSARQAGYLAGTQGVTVSGDDPIDAIESETRRRGFDPVRIERRGHTDLVLQHCPFAVIASTDPAVVCDVHLGLIEGLADALGAVEVRGLEIRPPERARCRVTLVRSDPDGSRPHGR